MARYTVAYGSFPHGWGDPQIETDDAEEAARLYDGLYADDRTRPGRGAILAIFDDNGEGEPLDSEQLRERVEEEAEKDAARLEMEDHERELYGRVLTHQERWALTHPE